MRLSLFFLSSCVVFFSCFKEIPTSDPTISQDVMVNVLTDIHLAESMLSEIKHRPTKDSLAIEYYMLILKQHEVDPEAFNESMNVYFSDPVNLDSLYTSVIANIAEIKKKDLVKKTK